MKPLSHQTLNFFKSLNWFSETRFAELCSFGKIQNLGGTYVSEEKFSVSLEKDFIFQINFYVYITTKPFFLKVEFVES